MENVRKERKRSFSKMDSENNSAFKGTQPQEKRKFNLLLAQKKLLQEELGKEQEILDPKKGNIEKPQVSSEEDRLKRLFATLRPDHQGVPEWIYNLEGKSPQDFKQTLTARENDLKDLMKLAESLVKDSRRTDTRLHELCTRVRETLDSKTKNNYQDKMDTLIDIYNFNKEQEYAKQSMGELQEYAKQSMGELQEYAKQIMRLYKVLEKAYKDGTDLDKLETNLTEKTENFLNQIKLTEKLLDEYNSGKLFNLVRNAKELIPDLNKSTHNMQACKNIQKNIFTEELIQQDIDELSIDDGNEKRPHKKRKGSDDEFNKIIRQKKNKTVIAEFIGETNANIEKLDSINSKLREACRESLQQWSEELAQSEQAYSKYKEHKEQAKALSGMLEELRDPSQENRPISEIDKFINRVRRPISEVIHELKKERSRFVHRETTLEDHEKALETYSQKINLIREQFRNLPLIISEYPHSLPDSSNETTLARHEQSFGAQLQEFEKKLHAHLREFERKLLPKLKLLGFEEVDQPYNYKKGIIAIGMKTCLEFTSHKNALKEELKNMKTLRKEEGIHIYIDKKIQYLDKLPFDLIRFCKAEGVTDKESAITSLHELDEITKKHSKKVDEVKKDFYQRLQQEKELKEVFHSEVKATIESKNDDDLTSLYQALKDSTMLCAQVKTIPLRLDSKTCDTLSNLYNELDIASDQATTFLHKKIVLGIKNQELSEADRDQIQKFNSDIKKSYDDLNSTCNSLIQKQNEKTLADLIRRLENREINRAMDISLEEEDDPLMAIAKAESLQEEDDPLMAIAKAESLESVGVKAPQSLEKTISIRKEASPLEDAKEKFYEILENRDKYDTEENYLQYLLDNAGIESIHTSELLSFFKNGDQSKVDDTTAIACTRELYREWHRKELGKLRANLEEELNAAKEYRERLSGYGRDFLERAAQKKREDFLKELRDTSRIPNQANELLEAKEKKLGKLKASLKKLQDNNRELAQIDNTIQDYFKLHKGSGKKKLGDG